MPRIFVIGQDWTFRTAVRAELLELGLEVLGFSSWREAQSSALSAPPDLVVLDATSADLPAEGLPASTDLIVVSSAVAPASAPTSATVLRKPLRVEDVIAAVRHRMEGHPA